MGWGELEGGEGCSYVFWDVVRVFLSPPSGRLPTAIIAVIT